jgi:hypothetical protein
MSLGKPTFTQFVYVEVDGNDTTGEGSYENPYLTYAHAMATILDNSPAKHYQVCVGPAIDTSGVVLKPYVTLSTPDAVFAKTTDINAAGPYTVLHTDYMLEVRYTATGAITIDLPSIAAVGEGRIVAVIDSGYSAGVGGHEITIARNGADKINNVAGNYTQNISGSAVWLKANTTTSNWEIV